MSIRAHRPHVHALLALFVLLVSAPLPPTSAAQVSDPAIITLATDVRSGPAVNDTVVGTVPAGHAVRVRELRGASARIESSAVSGWVPTAKLKIGGNASAGGDRGGAGSGLFRGLTGLFGGGGGGTDAKVPVGVRGLTKKDIASATPNPAAVEQAESMRVSQSDARAFARAGGLSSRRYEYLSASARADSNESAASDENSGGDN